jgi:hypothetical protein
MSRSETRQTTKALGDCLLQPVKLPVSMPGLLTMPTAACKVPAVSAPDIVEWLGGEIELRRTPDKSPGPTEIGGSNTGMPWVLSPRTPSKFGFVCYVS